MELGRGGAVLFSDCMTNVKCTDFEITCFVWQEAMQNQVNTNPERADPVANPVTVTAPFIFTSGEVVNLASFVSSANTKATSGRVLIMRRPF